MHIFTLIFLVTWANLLAFVGLVSSSALAWWWQWWWGGLVIFQASCEVEKFVNMIVKQFLFSSSLLSYSWIYEFEVKFWLILWYSSKSYLWENLLLLSSLAQVSWFVWAGASQPWHYDTWGQTILSCGVSPVFCRVFISIFRPYTPTHYISSATHSIPEGILTIKSPQTLANVLEVGYKIASSWKMFI